MPGISGPEVIRAAKQARPDLPTVLMTGYADADALGEDFRHVVLLKRPFRLQDLEAALGSAPFAAGSTARKWQCDFARSISPLTICCPPSRRNTPPARWNGSPRRTNRAEPRRLTHWQGTIP
jgi:hypothetical protein